MIKPLVKPLATGKLVCALVSASILVVTAGPLLANEPPAIPVTAVIARKAVLDRVINGIGTVAPLQSVTVRPRIDGQVVDISFDEGQLSKQLRCVLDRSS
jgi:multidrug efflux system membrane fusion protein